MNFYKSKQTTYFFTIKKQILLLVVFSVMSIHILETTPLLNIQDSAIIHTVYGTDKYLPSKRKSTLAIHLSPFFQHTATASNRLGTKVPAGNINGRWNMFAIYYNQPPPSVATLPNYTAGKIAAQNFTTGNLEMLDFTNEVNFNPDDPNALVGSYQAVAITYEKIGLRSQLSFDFGFGLGIVVKGGVATYKQIPTFTIDSNLQNILTPPATPPATEALQNPPMISPTQIFFNNFLSTRQRNLIAKDLGLDLYEQRKIDLEDLHVSLRWNVPFDIKEKGEHILTLAPYLSVGAWLPLAQTKDQNKAFSLSLGNDGFTGITAEGAFSFDFPEIIQISLGGGWAFYPGRDFTNYRVPTSEFQAGIIPWATNITKEPGALWYINASLKAMLFIPEFSCYFDYVYTEHLKDKITLKESNSARAAFFLPQKLERESAWKIQNFTAGLKYDLSAYCSFGLAIQSTISSSRTYRPTTFLGSIIINF
jgi:hypothetical protein